MQIVNAECHLRMTARYIFVFAGAIILSAADVKVGAIKIKTHWHHIGLVVIGNSTDPSQLLRLDISDFLLGKYGLFLSNSGLLRTVVRIRTGPSRASYLPRKCVSSLLDWRVHRP